MANISIVKGQLVLEGNWEAIDIDTLLIVLKKTEKWEYDITLVGKTHMEKHEKLTKESRIDFHATGRWSFHNNLMYLYSWLVNEERVTGDNYTKALDTLFKAMEEKKLILRWEYTDVESGQDFIKVAVGQHQMGSAYKDVLLYNEMYSEVYSCSLRSYFDNVLNGSDESTGEVRETTDSLAAVLDLDEEFVYNTVMKHPTFYGLPLWDYEFEVSELDEELIEALGKN